MSYKLKVKTLIISVLLILSALPIFNFYQLTDKRIFELEWDELFKTDALIMPMQKVLFPLGISLNSEQVLIGKAGWIYLGDYYGSMVTSRREGTLDPATQPRKLNEGLKMWEFFLKSRGVKAFQVMIGPDKATIYPENLPDWAKPFKPTVTDPLLNQEDFGLIFDARPALLTAKKHNHTDLYYKTDTHWNNLGAWIAFDAFIKDLSHKELIQGRWLTQEQVTLSEVKKFTEGDLSHLLKLQGQLEDDEPLLNINIGKQINVERIEYNTNEIIGNSGNPKIDAPDIPLLTKNNHALNHKKILWLRDSFGSAISPFMSATFAEVLQIHYEEVDSNILVELVEKFKPDYVFITTVERQMFDINIGLKQKSLTPSEFITN